MNIILIGMPGCGKSTLGRQVAKQLNKKFVDMDEEIEKTEGRKISDIFEKEGEGYFRDTETFCLRNLLNNDAVISTGGGIVVRDENIDLLKNSGAAVVFIDRPLEKIMDDIKTSDRPLLKDGAERLKTLYAARYEKYLLASNNRVVNDKARNDAIAEIINEVKTYENNGN